MGARMVRLPPLGALQGSRRHLPLLAALAPALWMSRSLVREVPLSYDHSTHLFKAWHFWTEMLARGRLRGWSHYWAFGFPADELVPCGGELWVALFRVLTLGQLSWPHTYALAFGALLLFAAYAAFHFARRYFGPTAGVASAWLTTLDPGAMLQGGWHWYADWGVWPVTLGVSFAVLGLARLEDVASTNTRRDVFWASLWLGAALVTHQLVILLLAIAVPFLLLDHWLRPSRSSVPKSLAVLAAVALALGAVAFFLIPFLARTGETMDLGHRGDALGAVAKRLIDLRTFQNLSPLVHGLCLLGGWLALRARVPGALYMASAGGALVVLSSDILIANLHLERLLHGVIKIEADRMLLAAKLFWFPLGGYGVWQLVRPSGTPSPAARPRARAFRIGGLVLLGAALLLAAGKYLREQKIDTTVKGAEEQRYWHDFQALVSWSRELRQGSSEFYRIAYHSWRGNHLPTLAAVFDQTPIYNLYFTPTQIFDKLPMTDEPEMLQALSVKYVVSPRDLRRGDLAFERRFGQLRVYRFTGYRAEPFRVLGPGRAELLEFEPERIRLRLEGTAPDTRLVLHVASYPRWRASAAGSGLPITAVPVYGVEYPILMEVPAQDGEITFDYVYRAPDWAGLLLTCASVLGLVWMYRGGSAELVPSLRLSERLSRAFRWGLAAAAAVGAALIVLRIQNRAALLPRESVFQRLEGLELTLGDHSCTKLRELSFQCGQHRVRAGVFSGVWGMHLCMNAPAEDELRIHLNTALGTRLWAKYEPAPEGPGSISASIDGAPLGTARTRPATLGQQAIQFDTRAHAGRNGNLEVVLGGAAMHCFDVRILP